MHLLFKNRSSYKFSVSNIISLKETIWDNFYFSARPLHRFTFGYFQLTNRSNLSNKHSKKKTKGQPPCYLAMVAARCDYNMFQKWHKDLMLSCWIPNCSCKWAHPFINIQMLCLFSLPWGHNAYQKVSNDNSRIAETVTLRKDESVLTDFKDLKNTGNVIG